MTWTKRSPSPGLSKATNPVQSAAQELRLGDGAVRIHHARINRPRRPDTDLHPSTSFGRRPERPTETPLPAASTQGQECPLGPVRSVEPAPCAA